MKFSHSLRLNAVPEWAEHYVDYENLKKMIFDFEKRHIQEINHSRDDEEKGSEIDEDANFTKALDVQLDKVVSFYDNMVSSLEMQLADLEASIEACPEDPYPDHATAYVPNTTSTTPVSGTAGSDGSSEETTAGPHVIICSPSTVANSVLSAPLSGVHEGEAGQRLSALGLEEGAQKVSFESRPSTQMTRESEVAELYVEHLSDLRMQLVRLYVLISDLESYVDINKTAFAKILKKYDKVLNREIRDNYFQRKVLQAKPFGGQTSIAWLQSSLARIEQVYADLFCCGQVPKAARQIRTHLRDQVTYERNTVWKDMVHQERQKHGALYKQKLSHMKMYRIFSIAIPAKQAKSGLCFLVILLIFAILLNIHIFNLTEENHCFALLIFAALLWATEAIPLYATSLLIPFLIVPLGILRQKTENGLDSVPMSAHDAAAEIFASMFSGTIMMLLGGFALAGALSKYGIAKAFATHVLSRAGTRPRQVLLAIMFVAAFLSMWISNVATPVLCFSLIDPILRTLPDDSPVAPALLLGIALASCIGGLTSPISSPQNIITLQYMNPNPGWGAWFAVALPIAILAILSCWVLILAVYRPGRACQHLNTIKPTKDKITLKHVFILLVSIITIALWCAESSIEFAIGSTGVIATIPLFMFFGTGLLGKDDLHAFLWSVVILAQGGMALGHAVTSSGLLQDIALTIRSGIEDLPPIAILVVFSSLILVFSTFVSHTVAALIILPIVQQVGQQLPVPHPNLLVMGAGLACSAGMGLPVSGFPNMAAVMLEDPRGKQYLTARDFIIAGVPTSIVCTVLICTLGYGVISAMGLQ
ncbi:SPX domain-containing protein [Dichotomocladium elegans]|nr:SPX domain-containing protein [Dichotomocladium elegans]